MTSLIYDSCLYKVFRSMIHFDTDSFKVLLVSSDYIPDKKIHAKRSDIYGEIFPVNGYTRGGVSINVSTKLNTDKDQIDISLGNATWTSATITASGAVYYRNSEGLSSSDDLVCFIQFNNEVSSTNGSFTITPSILRIQN